MSPPFSPACRPKRNGHEPRRNLLSFHCGLTPRGSLATIASQCGNQRGECGGGPAQNFLFRLILTINQWVNCSSGPGNAGGYPKGRDPTQPDGPMKGIIPNGCRIFQECSPCA